jgi:hypothetical protein
MIMNSICMSTADAYSQVLQEALRLDKESPPYVYPVMRCEYCRGNTHADSLSCPHCGAPLSLAMEW